MAIVIENLLDLVWARATPSVTMTHHPSCDGKMAMAISALSTSGVDDRCRQVGVAEKYLRMAVVEFPDCTAATFYIHKNASGTVLFDLITKFLLMSEKGAGYMGLTYPDRKTNKPRFLCNDKPIAKQVESRDWQFTLAFKFYVSEPAEESDGLTRHYLVEQCRRDIYERRIPTDSETQARLAAYIAQAELGNYEQNEDYGDYIRRGRFSTSVDYEFIVKIQEYHEGLRDLTPQQVELLYLNVCKVLPMYGCHSIETKDTENGVPIEVGVGGVGIVTYEATRGVTNSFAWKLIDKISFRRKYFCVKFLPELPPTDIALEGKSVVFKLASSTAAERFYKLAIEHHEFFRLLRPSPRIKRKSSFFHWASQRFRGRPSHTASSLSTTARHFDVNETIRTIGLEETMDDADMTMDMSVLDRTQVSGEGSVYSLHGSLEDTLREAPEEEQDESDTLLPPLEPVIDHDVELTRAILEATNLNPNMAVERIEVKCESSC
uniref:FERM domain-containing protein n=1 Tax=Steinernema glaseri TaxID=37863 RepID=A0A1I7YXP1_9BILA